MKIISETSILQRLPVGINEEQLLLLDTIRTTFEMIESNYKLLDIHLKNFSNETKKKQNVSEAFGIAWNIIDNTSRLIKLYKKLPSKTNHQMTVNVSNINIFRNTFQHLDERINESLLKNRVPYYGVIYWFYKDFKNKQTVPHCLYHGLFYDPNIKFTIPDLKKSRRVINDIHIQSVDKKNIIQLNLSNLFSEIIIIRESLENDIWIAIRKNNLKPCDWKTRKDILIRFKNK